MFHNESEWRKRVSRAYQLSTQYDFARDILRFYAEIAGFQAELFEELQLREKGPSPRAPMTGPLALPLGQMTVRFASFLMLLQKQGPAELREKARELIAKGEVEQFELREGFWKDNKPGGAGASDFLARAYLQPYAVRLRQQSQFKHSGPVPFVCPFCGRKPGVGVLRALGDGGQRFLICSLCLMEWEFRRILCPGCGEEDHSKLPVYTAEELQHVRVEACDSCRTYIKTVDQTKSGLAEPIVDEIAAVPLDLWAQGKGYSKLQTNLLQL